MNIRDVQTYLKSIGLYAGAIDGDAGKQTLQGVLALLMSQHVAGIEEWQASRRLVAAEQLLCRIAGIDPGQIDGLAGAQTRYACEVFDARQLNAGKPAPAIENWRDDATAPAVASRALPPVTSSKAGAPSSVPQWPRQSAAAMDSFFGPKGANCVKLILPYRMRLAWDLPVGVSEISCNAKVKESLERIFVRALDHYGADDIRRLRLDLYGGCLNVRRMRGSSSAWSIHSWGCAFDMDPDHNALNMHRAQATLDGAEYDAWWRFVEDEGAVSLGRARDYDWMHFQFARL
ncbi:MAG: M15 family peptidase [Xanthobacteraceae bacterium]|nr:MAG: M15 family peptidase [Xanthobacteraceae bacterium]